MPTIPENEFVSDVNQPMKPKPKRKYTSPRKVLIEYNKINLTNESLKLKFLNTLTFSLNRYQTSEGKPSQPRKPSRKRGSREEQVLRR